MNCEKFKRTRSVTYILCKKDNGNILKNTIIYKLQESFRFILEAIKVDNQQVSISNICVTGNFSFLVFFIR